MKSVYTFRINWSSRGLILNAGLRVDYFNPLKDGYEVGFPVDKDFAKLYTTVYGNLGGAYNSYERWLLFRELLDSPPGWPTLETEAQVKLSPRLGVSYPITENSKMYFNYGHFYQRPSSGVLYNMRLDATSPVIPTPDMPMARTVQYEFGYEQSFLENFLVNITAYYKDISDEPLMRTYVGYYGATGVSKYYPDYYKDVRGVEIRFERNSGRYVMFSAMYDYMLMSDGTAGLSTLYEDLVTNKENVKRSAKQNTLSDLPRANINLTLFTPSDFGQLWGGWFANFFFEWKSGGQVLLNSDQEQKSLQQWIDVVNYWNIDMRCSKSVDFGLGNVEFYCMVKNLTNNKWLSTGNFTTSQKTAYVNILKEKGGNWGDYDSEKFSEVFKNSWENVLFQNPRRVIIGARINL